MCNSKKGFTLIELMVVMSIISMLASIVLAAVTNVRRQARDSHRMQELTQIRTALELYYSSNGQYPVSTGPLTNNYWKNDCQPGVTFVIPELITNGFFSGIQDLVPCSAGHWGFSYGSNGKGYKLISHSELSGAINNSFIDTAQDQGPDCGKFDGPNKTHTAIWTPDAVCWLESTPIPDYP